MRKVTAAMFIAMDGIRQSRRRYSAFLTTLAHGQWLDAAYGNARVDR